jgi:TPP-dependent pyruvate/acetoin dehydrogenase alpha subunit
VRIRCRDKIGSFDLRRKEEPMSAVQTPASSGVARDQLIDAYRVMRTIREFEERVHTEFATGDIPSFAHLYAG